MRYIYYLSSLLLLSFPVSAQRVFYPGGPGPSDYGKLGRVESKFNENAEGWQLLDANGNNPQEIHLKSHNEDLTHPGEHKLFYLSGKMTAANAWYYWVAPENFLGNWMFSSYRLELWFSLLQSIAGTDNTYADVIISNGGHSLYYRFTDKPGINWRAYSILLDETGGLRTSSSVSAPLATKNDIKKVLSNVTSFRIRAKYNSTAGLQAGLENVRLYTWPQSEKPYITDVTPSSGKPLTSVTISGSDFGSTINENEVYFGGVRGNITHAASTQLAVQVPVGARFGPITITNLTTGYSTKTITNFNPLYDNNGDAGGKIIPAAMDYKLDIPTEGKSESVKMGDIDGDGKNDLVVTSGGVEIYRNLGVTGDITLASFAPKVELEYGSRESVLADFNGDGKLDIAVIHNTGSSAIAVYRNISTPGTISFEPAQLFPTLNYTSHGLHAADIDGDGLLDLLATHSSSGISPYLYILQNTSGIGFVDFSWGKSFTAPAFSAATNLTTADLDKDGKVEVLVISGFRNTIHVFPNRSFVGNMRLEEPFVIDSPGSVYGLTTADLDKDGKLDLVWKGSTPNDIIIRKNNYSSGDLSAADFSTEIILTSALHHYGGICIADINADNKPDIIATDSGVLGIFQNIGTDGELSHASFIEAVLYEGGNSIYPLNPAVGDLDGDAKPDVVLAFTNSAKLSIYRNECFPAPRIDHLNNSANANSNLSITGEHLFASNVTPTVHVGGTTAQVSSSNAGELIVKVPHTAVYRPVAVTNHGLSGFSNIPFSITFNAEESLGANTFVKRADFTLINAGGNIAIANLNNDNFPDVLVPDYISGNKARVFRNSITLAGSPINESTLILVDTIDANGRNIGISDIDGDGIQDIIVQGYTYRNTSVNSAITFEEKVSNSLSSMGRVKTNLDFNRDGKMDAVGTSSGNAIVIAENRSKKGSFVASTDYGTWGKSFSIPSPGGNVSGIDGGDFDQDGYDDIVYCVYSLNKIHVVRNKGENIKLSAQSFAAAIALDAPAKPVQMQVGDFNNDGKLDFATVNQDAGSFSIFQNTTTQVGATTFDRKDFSVEANPVDLALADFNGDSKIDIAIIHQTTTTTGLFSVVPNTTSGSISFGTPINYQLPNVPSGIAAGDINLDKRPDILITRESGLGNGNTNAVLSIYENTIKVGGDGPDPSCQGFPVPTISSLGGSLSASEGLTYQWYAQDMLLPGETQQTLSIDPIEGNTYAVEVTNGICKLRSADFVYFVTALISGFTENLIFYPNPTKSVLFMEVKGPIKPLEMTIVNSFGQVLKKLNTVSKDQTIELGDVPEGLYFIKIQSDHDFKVFKIYKVN